MTETEFPDLPDEEFATIAADLPWPYDDSLPGEGTRGAVEHYETVPLGDLGRLGIEVEQIAADEAHLYLWTTASFMQEACKMMTLWGFDFKQVLTWVKVNDAPTTLPHERDQSTRIRRYMGMGQYYRNGTEFLLFGSRGNKDLKRKDLSTVFFAEPSDHSAKPEKAYRLIEQASEGPYFEMFSRRERTGWTTWGDEAPEDTNPEAEPSGEPTTDDAGAW